jgi:hypothetical protein
MTRHDNPQASTAFTVTELRAPSDTRAGGVYQIDASSSAPMRIVGRDKLGRPIEETIPTVYYHVWIDPSGNVLKVPMRTSSVYSIDGEAARYEQDTTIDLLRSGWLPMHHCPYTPVFRNVTFTPYLVANDDRVDDCGGKPDGCEHLKPILAARRRLDKERHAEQEEQFARLNPSQASDLLQRLAQSLSVVEGIADRGEEMATAPAPLPLRRGRPREER